MKQINVPNLQRISKTSSGCRVNCCSLSFSRDIVARLIVVQVEAVINSKVESKQQMVIQLIKHRGDDKTHRKTTIRNGGGLGFAFSVEVPR